MDYISYIRSKVGHDKVILTFAGGILADKDGRVLLQLRGDKKTWAIPGGAMTLIFLIFTMKKPCACVSFLRKK